MIYNIFQKEFGFNPRLRRKITNFELKFWNT